MIVDAVAMSTGVLACEMIETHLDKINVSSKIFEAF